MPDMLFPENLLEEDTAYSNDMEMEYEEESEPRGAEAYRPSMFFDAASGDFIRQNDGRIKEATGAEAWEQWCHKAICTQRGACEAYGDEFGVDFERVLQAESREEAENILNRQIKEALMGDQAGRTQFVGQIEFFWKADSLSVTVPVTGMYGTAAITASYEEMRR